MTKKIWNDRFRVLRVVPATQNRKEDEVVATLDLIHVEYKALLFDCELHLVDGGAYVDTPDPRVWARFWLEPGFCEDDCVELMDQMVEAVCDYFGLPADSGSTQVLDEFLRGPQWPEWIRAHPIILSAEKAVECYVATAVRRDNRVTGQGRGLPSVVRPK